MGVRGLTADELYWFRVTAVDAQGGEAASEPLTLTLKLRTTRTLLTCVIMMTFDSRLGKIKNQKI